jgi:hypothetical protein
MPYFDGPDSPYREIKTHVVDGDPVPQVTILTEKEVGPGGAPFRYSIRWTADGGEFLGRVALTFQHGPQPADGLNGLTNEALLAVVADRLAGFQAGEHPCEENDDALAWTRRALDALKSRTERRLRESGRK